MIRLGHRVDVGRVALAMVDANRRVAFGVGRGGKTLHISSSE